MSIIVLFHKVIFELLEDIGAITEGLKSQIDELADEKQLKTLLKLATRAEFIEPCEKETQEIYQYQVGELSIVFQQRNSIYSNIQDDLSWRIMVTG